MSAGKWDGDDFLRIIRRGMFSPTKGEVSDSDILGHYLYAALVTTASVYRLPELESYEDITTIAGVQEYALSSTDVLKINEVEGITSGTVPRLKLSSRQNEIRYANATGSPFRYFESSESHSAIAISFIPIPSESDNVFRVWYTKTPAVVTASGDGEPASTTELNEAWDYPLALRAIINGLEFSGRADKIENIQKALGDAEARARRALQRAPEKVWQPETRFAAAVNRD